MNETQADIVANALRAANDKYRSDIETGAAMPNDERKRKRDADALRQIAIASGMATPELLEGVSDEQIISGDFDLPKYSWKGWDRLQYGDFN